MKSLSWNFLIWECHFKHRPRLLWIAISFSRGSSQPRVWTRVSRIVDRRFTMWATREILYIFLYFCLISLDWSRVCLHAQLLSRVQFLACQAPLSMEFSRQEHQSGLPFPTAGDLPDPGIEPTSLASPALAGRFFTIASPEKPLSIYPK